MHYTLTVQWQNPHCVHVDMLTSRIYGKTQINSAVFIGIKFMEYSIFKINCAAATYSTTAEI